MRKRRKRKGGIVKAVFCLLPDFMLFCVMIFIFSHVFGYISAHFFEGGLKHNNTAYSEEYTIAENMEVLQRIDPKIWAVCTNEEKLEFVQTVANAEANYLGIPKPLPVRVYDLPDNRLGQFAHEEYEIQIDEDYLYFCDVNQDGYKESTVLDIVKTICHEAYHVYQRELVSAYLSVDDNHQNLLLFLPASEYLENLKNYNYPKDDYYAYYNQRLEKDARAYAEDAIMDYIKVQLDKDKTTS